MVTIITHHPTPNTQHPIGEVSGEMSGEVFRQHPTIRNARLQRVSAHFGEVLGIITMQRGANEYSILIKS